MSKPLVIFGISSFAEIADFYFTHDGGRNVVAFTLSDDHFDGREFSGRPTVPFSQIEKHYPSSDFDMFIAIGYSKLNTVRERIFHEAKNKGYALATYLCSRSTHWGDTKIGENCFILEDVSIQPFVSIGDNTVIWSGNHIGHHVCIGSHCFITSHVVISGLVKIGDFVFLGVNSTIGEGIEIANKTIVGAGALVLKSTEEGETYATKRTRPLARRVKTSVDR